MGLHDFLQPFAPDRPRSALGLDGNKVAGLLLFIMLVRRDTVIEQRSHDDGFVLGGRSRIDRSYGRLLCLFLGGCRFRHVWRCNIR
ncbi:hypothetical protein D3C85_1430520 [compost metagenome]